MSSKCRWPPRVAPSSSSRITQATCPPRAPRPIYPGGVAGIVCVTLTSRPEHRVFAWPGSAQERRRPSRFAQRHNAGASCSLPQLRTVSTTYRQSLTPSLGCPQGAAALGRQPVDRHGGGCSPSRLRQKGGCAPSHLISAGCGRADRLRGPSSMTQSHLEELCDISA